MFASIDIRNALGYKIVGYPVRIENQRYTRNAFYFNLCFVCNSWARTVQYEPIVRKLSEYFVSWAEKNISTLLTVSGERVPKVLIYMSFE